MRKKFLIALLVFVCSMFLLVGCVDNKFILQDLTVESKCKTEYKLGEALDIEGGVLKATYSNNSSQLIPFTDERVSFSALEKNKTGKQIINIRFDTMSASMEVEVLDIVEKIELASPPSKTTYIQGEKLVVRGAKIKVFYDGGVETTVDVTDDMVSGFDTNKVEVQAITVSLTNNGNTFTAAFNVTVKVKSVISITIAKLPAKLNYKVGAALELADAEFRISFDNNSPVTAQIFFADEMWQFRDKVTQTVLDGEVVISSEFNGEATLPGFDSSKKGNHNIYFTYGSVTAYGYRVKVVDKVIEKYEITGSPKTIVKGTPAEKLIELWMQGLTIHLTYSDGEIRTYIVPKDTISGDMKIEGYDPLSKENEQVITFDFGMNGIIKEIFTMQEPQTTSLQLKSSGEYVITENNIDFYADDTLDMSLWEYELFYNNGTSKIFTAKQLSFETDILPGEYNLSARTFHFVNTGKFHVTVGYNNFQNHTVNITIKAKNLTSLVVDSAPNQTEYSVGEQINFQGAKLHATYVDAVSGEYVRTREVFLYPNPEIMLSVSYDNTRAGKDIPVVLTLTEKQRTASAQFTVSFSALVLSISVKDSTNVKKDYIKGESFNPAGLVVTITYNGAPGEDVLLKETNEGGAWSFSPEMFSEIGSQTIAIGYLGKQTSIQVNVTNDIVRFEVANPVGNVFREGQQFGDIIVGATLSLKGYTFRAIRQNGETEQIALPNQNVITVADNTTSSEAVPSLEVKFTYLGISKIFYMNRLPRERTYYELAGTLVGLQTIDKPFDANGWVLWEHFNNGAKENLTTLNQVKYIVPEITIPEEGNRVQVDVTLQVGGRNISFRYNGATTEISAVPVMFYTRIATTFVKENMPDILVDQNTPAAEVLQKLAVAGTSFRVDFSNGERDVILVLSEHLADFILSGYVDSKNEYQSVRITYKLSTAPGVDITLRINPKELVSASFSGFLRGAQGTAEQWKVVEGTDLDYTNAYLNIVYGFYDEGKDAPRMLPAETMLITAKLSDFTKSKATGVDGLHIPVIVTYSYKAKRDVTVKITTKSDGNTLGVILVSKQVLEISFEKKPKVSYIEGENFTYNDETGTPGVLRVSYNNGSTDKVSLIYNGVGSSGNTIVEGDVSTDPTKCNVLSNGLEQYFSSVGGYGNVALTGGEEKTFTAIFRYMGKDISLPLILKDRKYVDMSYALHVAKDKIYGDEVMLDLTIKLKGTGTVVTEGARRYILIDEAAAEFTPNGKGFSSGGREYGFLPAGKYTVRATFDGVACKYNTAEAKIGNSITVAAKDLFLQYNEIGSIIYGEENPDLIGYLTATGFVGKESLSDYGELGYIALQNNVNVGAPKNAGTYSMGVTGISSPNYKLVLPGSVGNPYGSFTINKRNVYIVPQAASVRYGETTPIIQYSVFEDALYQTPLAEEYKKQLKSAPASFQNGVSLDDGITAVMQPNAGKYEINSVTMGNQNPNFNLSMTKGTYFTIAKAELAVKFLPNGKLYGEILSEEEFLSNLEIYLNSEILEAVPAFHVTFSINGGIYLGTAAAIAAMKNSGRYAVKPGEMSFANYVVRQEGYTAGDYIVTPKEAVITATGTEKERSKTYGTADPLIAYSASGLVGSDTLTGAAGREAGENVMDGNTPKRYPINIGTLNNGNYRLVMAQAPAYFTITKRELALNISAANLSKYYDGKKPSISQYRLTLKDGSESIYISEDLKPSTENIQLYFSTESPDRTINAIDVLLRNNDTNHTITLAEKYVYNINRLPVKVKWVKKINGTEIPLEKNGSYPYIYGDKHYFTAVADLTGLGLPAGEGVELTFIEGYASYYNADKKAYGVENVGTYSPSVTDTQNRNLTIQTALDTTFTFAVVQNSIFVDLAESSLTKVFDGTATKFLSKNNAANFTFNEYVRDANGKQTFEKVEITDAKYKAALLGIIDFKVGSGVAGASDVIPEGYGITINVQGTQFGLNFEVILNDDSKLYKITPRPIGVSVISGNSKTYDGNAPSLNTDNLTTTQGSYLTTQALLGMLTFEQVEPSGKMGDVGTYNIIIDSKTASKNLIIKFDKPYTYTISKKTIELVFGSGSGYYKGEKQLKMTDADVSVYGNNLGQGDEWSNIFPALIFNYEYKTDGAVPSLMEGNGEGQKGNVGKYNIALNQASTHKNYSFMWRGTTEFTIMPAEVNIVPGKTSLVYGSNEDNAPYKTEYGVRFERGSDNSADGSIFKALVREKLILGREKPTVFNAGLYSVVLGAEWVANCINGIHNEFLNYKVQLSASEGWAFTIEKQLITVQIGEYNKIYGSAMASGSVPVMFPKLESEIKFSDTLHGILDANYVFAEISDSVYGFSSERFMYTYLGGGIAENPENQFAAATREPNGQGDVYGYETQFEYMLNSSNYTFVYQTDGERQGKGLVRVLPKTLNVTVQSFDWVYRDEWVGGSGEDQTYLNLGKYMSIGGKVDGSPDMIKYPVLDKDGGFSSALRAMLQENAGTKNNITADWFNLQKTNSVETNHNYIYDFDAISGSKQVTIVKATLTAAIRTMGGDREITKTYGTVPQKNELKISYQGFRGGDSESNALGFVPATLPDFVETLTEGVAVLYGFSTAGHRINPIASSFSSTNYVVDTDGAEVIDPFLFKVEKKKLTVRSAPPEGSSVILLKKFFGEQLRRDSEYSVSYGEDAENNFVTSVILTDGTVATVADSAQTVFYDYHSEVEWVDYNKKVNVIKNVPTATEIAPNIVKMNEIGTNYDTVAAVGESLKIEIYNKIESITLAHQEAERGFGYVSLRKNPMENTTRIKITYIDGEAVYVDLKVAQASSMFENANHIGNISVVDYLATNVDNNQDVSVTVAEANGMAGGTDTKPNVFTLRNIPLAETNLNNITQDVVGAMDASTSVVEKFVTADGAGNIASVARFNIVKTSFVLMRNASGGQFDFVIYNAYNVAEASYRYIIRAKTGTYDETRGNQVIMVIEQKKQADGTYVDSGSDVSTTEYSIGGINLFDQELHFYQIYLGKLNNSIQIVIDNYYTVTHKLTLGGTLGAESKLGVTMKEMFGYIRTLTLGAEGYAEEDAVKIVANNKEAVIVASDSEQYIYIRPQEYFNFKWSYANDFYLENPSNKPVIKFYLDGAATTPEKVAVTRGTYTLTAKAFRSADKNAIEISSASVVVSVADGYVRDKFVKYGAEDEVIETVTPSINTPRILTGGNSDTTYQGVAEGIAYTHYSLNFMGIDFTAENSTVNINVKTNNPDTNAFNIPAADKNYIGLTMQINRFGGSTITKLRLQAGDSEKNFYKESAQTTAISWTEQGIYSINVTMDKKNLYVLAEVLLNGKMLQTFYIDGADSKIDDQYGQSAGANQAIKNLEEMKNKAPISWAIYQLANETAAPRGGAHSISLRNANAVIAEVVINTHAELLSNYVRTTKQLNGAPKSAFTVHETGGNVDTAGGLGNENSYMLARNGFASFGSSDVKASLNKYETYGVRFKATPVTNNTNKLRLILAENGAKTTADVQKHYSVNSTRNVALTFLRNGNTSRLFFSFNDGNFTTLDLDNFGEPTNRRYEQEVYSYDGATPGVGQVDLFDGKEHTIVVTFSRDENNVETSSKLAIQAVFGNCINVYIDGKEYISEKKYFFPCYNNIEPWNFTSTTGNEIPVGNTNVPFYDRFFLDERTYAGLSYRGLNFTLFDLSVSEKENHTTFLSRA